jgi:hypothetical protein
LDDDTQPRGDRRTREQERRSARQRRMGIVGTVLTLGIVALVALVATDTLRVSGTGPTLASGKSSGTTTTTPSNPGKQVKKINSNKPARPLSHAAPLRLWIGGDSLSGELGQQLGIMVSKLGIVQAHVDYKVSSGLSSDNVRNWPQNFIQEDTQYKPEALIFMVGANDAPIVGSAVDSTGVPVWEAKYRAQVDRMMDLLVGGSAQRTVFWVGSPTLGTRYDHGAKELDRVMSEEAAKRPTVVYIDAYALFSGTNGGYSSSLPDASGNRVQMRIGDGVHFTNPGALYLAKDVYKFLDARWHLTTQAAPGETINYTIEPEGGSVGGTNLGSGSGNGSNNNSSSTTAAPATVAPTTTVPKTVAPTTTAPHSTTTIKPAPTTAPTPTVP